MHLRTHILQRKPESEEQVVATSPLFEPSRDFEPLPEQLPPAGSAYTTAQDAVGGLPYGHNIANLPIFPANYPATADEALDFVDPALPYMPHSEEADPMAMPPLLVDPAQAEESATLPPTDAEAESAAPVSDAELEQLVALLAPAPAASQIPATWSLPTPAPTNMGEVYDEIGKDEHEILVYQLEEDNDLVVLLAGSEPADFKGINSLFPNAVLAGLGIESSYSRMVRTMLRDLGQNFGGSKVHLAGFSQGGIVAQNLSSDPKLFSDNNLSLASVSTYGTPEMLFGERNPTADYSRNFDAPGDLVSHLGAPKNGTSLLRQLGFLTLLSSPALLPIAAVAATLGVATHMTAYGKGADTDVRQQMEATATPFKQQNWKLVAAYKDGGDSEDTEEAEKDGEAQAR